MNVNAASPVQIAVEGVITRCGCTPEQKAAPDWHALSNTVCPRPRRIENLGRMAYWHRSVWKRLGWRVSQWIRLRAAGAVRMTQGD